MEDGPTLEDRYKEHDSYVHRKVADETILVPVRSNVADLECIYSLNETASRVWELLDGKRTVGEVLQVILDEFEVEPDEAEADLLEIMTQLLAAGAVRKV